MASEHREDTLKPEGGNKLDSVKQWVTFPRQHGKHKLGVWQRFANWIHCICVVTFDLELGQAIEVRIK